MPDVADLRREYESQPLRRSELAEDPVEQFRRWFEEANSRGLLEPNAMTLATVDEVGRPWQRMVLLKAFDQRGFVFFTNLESRKARHIEANPQVSLHFPWIGQSRQVAISGAASRVDKAEAVAYFASRPFGSKVGAWVSRQSAVVSSRSLLEAKLREMKEKFKDGQVPLPSFWGGYRVKADRFEFWQGNRNRLHDRFLYEAAPDGAWSLSRLAP